MANKRSALGKGLGALIGDIDPLSPQPSQPRGDVAGQAEAVAEKEKKPSPAAISEIAIDKIVANPYQPRTRFDEDALEELTASVRQFGIIQPITVRRIGNSYQIISGERRYKAARAAGLSTVPAYIKETDDRGMLEMAIVENIQREDLDAIEVALSFQRLIDECRITQESMAEKVGKKRATVANYLRLLRLPDSIQACIRDRKISMGHAKAILALSDPLRQRSLCEEIVKKDLSVRQAEEKARKILEESAKQSKRGEEPEAELPDRYYRVLEIIGRYFGDRISLKRNSQGKGRIVIQFSSDQEVEAFLKAIENLN